MKLRSAEWLSPIRTTQPATLVRAAPARVIVAMLAIITMAMVVRVAWDPSLNDPPRIGARLDPQISLIDQNGHPFTNAEFGSKPRLLLFGYTSCPDICPTSLAALSENISELGPDAKKLDFVFVTVDPQRDTPARLKSYLSAFSPRLIGLTGKPGALSKALDGYHVFRARRHGSNGDYSVDHASTAFLISGDGHLRETVKEDELGTKVALAKIRHLLSS
ncbi:MAG: SCO family protein [Proteobacteria bacterium]|nr:SCO family protein [Pseudomonadota bacterium]